MGAWVRFGAACLVAPILPFIATMTPFALSDSDAAGFRFLFTLYAVYSYPCAFVLGLPGYVLLGWRGWTGLGAYLLAGFLLGGIAYSAMIALAGHLIVLFWISIVSGPLIAGCFWLIARPDRHNLVLRAHE